MTIVLNGTNGITNASWTTSTRPSSPSTGQFGYNTTLNLVEFYNGTSWQPVAPTSIVPVTISYLIAAGGGAGGMGGGGAGGLLTGTVTLTIGSVYTITVGGAALAIAGGKLSHLVGGRGEVLDSLQELTRLAVS